MKDKIFFQETQKKAVVFLDTASHIKMDEYCEIENQNVALRIHSNSSFSKYHNHDFFEINYVYKGLCDNLIDDVSHKMEKGDMAITHPGVHHILTAPPKAVVINILINKEWFNSNFNREFITSPSNLSHFIKKCCSDSFYKYIIFNSKSSSVKYHSIVNKMIKISTSPSYSNKYLLLEAYVFELICELLDEEVCFLCATRGSANDIASSMKAYMHTNISDVNLKKLSEKFGYSVSHICRIFKSSYNLTFKELLIEAKIKKAKSYLSHTDKKISEIAFLLGYESVEYFDRLFKKETSYTPSEYRINVPDDHPNN